MHTRNWAFHISTMKEKLPIRMTILLSFFIQAIGGWGVKSIKQGENTSRVLTSYQVNKTTAVCVCIPLTFYVYLS
jgi:hypothetical protein